MYPRALPDCPAILSTFQIFSRFISRRSKYADFRQIRLSPYFHAGNAPGFNVITSRFPTRSGNPSESRDIAKIWIGSSGTNWYLTPGRELLGILIKRYTSDLRMECQDRHRLPNQFATRLAASLSPLQVSFPESRRGNATNAAVSRV